MSDVVYFCTRARRLTDNPALARAADLARAQGGGLAMVELLEVDAPLMNSRLARFVLDGMEENAKEARRRGIEYQPMVATKDDAVSWVQHQRATLVGDLDPWPSPYPLDEVVEDGLVPWATAPAAKTAMAMRRHLNVALAGRLAPTPDVVDRPAAALRLPPAAPLQKDDVPTVDVTGGPAAAARVLTTFLARLARYPDRNHPDAAAESGLSPYLRHGHIGIRGVVDAVLRGEQWSPGRVQDRRGRKGWWGLSEAAEGFLDQVVTWRELGRINAHHQAGRAHEAASRRHGYSRYADYASLPDWARATLARHGKDPRRVVPLARLREARSDDPVWDAGQRELVRTGRMHNYVRMVWGKRMLEWSRTPRQAMQRLFHLNDTYALDGRDPNSVTGIHWVFGRFDRPWGPERPVYGTVRYMSSERTPKKLRMADYLDRFSK